MPASSPTPRHLLGWSLPLLLALAGGCAFEPRSGLPSPAANRAAQTAISMIGRPYHYGGATPRGFDCSGLVQYSYAQAGVRLPHGTEYLLRSTRTVPYGDMKRGDLLFFDLSGKKSSHVAIYLGDGRFVHAPATGRSVDLGSLADPFWKDYFSAARRIDAD